MSGHMNAHPTSLESSLVHLSNGRASYEIPRKIAEKYRIPSEGSVSADEVFAAINQKYTKPGALLRGIRMREDITQKEMALQLQVHQSHISQMERGLRPIGRTIAQRVEKKFGLSYRAFLS